MAKPQVTFLLGAGTSKAFGLPLTNEIFPRLWKSLADDEFLGPEDNKLVKRILTCLYPGLTRKTPEEVLPGITEVLSMIDHFIANNSVPQAKISIDNLMLCRQAVEIAIVNIIEERFYYEYDEKDSGDQSWKKFIMHLKALSGSHKVNVISTNYDIMVEFGLFQFVFDQNEEKFINQVDFGIRWRDPHDGSMHNPPVDPKYSIYKLHGSTNWLHCDLCYQSYVNIYGSIFNQIADRTISEFNTCHCGHALLSSVIVSPSLEREVNNTNLRYIWNGALESLRTSDQWIFIGYSMPAEDLNIRSIITRALNGHQSTPQIKIVQRNEKLKPRFESILGKVEYYSEGIDNYLTLKTN